MTGINSAVNKYKEMTRSFTFYKAVGRAILIGFFVHILSMAIFFTLSLWFLFFINLSSSVMYAGLYILSRRKIVKIVYILGCLDILTVTFLTTMMLGWDTGFHLYILIIIPTLFYLPDIKTYFRLITTFSIFIIYCTLFYLSHHNPPVYQLTPGIHNYLNYFNIVAIFYIITIINYMINLSLTNVENGLRSMNEELSLLAHVDPLTKILNRRSMHDFIQKSIKKAQTTGEHMSFIVADIDDFKKVNDTYGHACGDMVLEEVARVMAGTMREGDRISRWGGEEFLAVITNGSLERAIVVAERMRKSINDCRMTYNNETVSVTATFGISIRSADEDAAGCINRADMALYRGKKAGKNRVALWTPDMKD